MVGTLSPVVTLLGAILGMAAIALIPGKTDIKDGKTQRFTSWGKTAILVLAVVLLAMAGAVLYVWMTSSSDEIFSVGNALLFLGMGIGLVVNNVVVMEKIKRAAKEKEPAEVHEVETMPADAKASPKPVAPAKPVKRPAKKKVKPVAIKAPQPPKAEKPEAPAVEAEEIIEVPKVCPSCDTPIEHSQDGKCPVCGYDLQK